MTLGGLGRLYRHFAGVLHSSHCQSGRSSPREPRCRAVRGDFKKGVGPWAGRSDLRTHRVLRRAPTGRSFSLTTTLARAWIGRVSSGPGPEVRRIPAGPATYLARPSGARHLALAAAGTRQSHTYHQHASACRVPAATTRTAPAMRRTPAPEPLGGDAGACVVGDAALEVQLGLEVGGVGVRELHAALEDHALERLDHERVQL